MGYTHSQTTECEQMQCGDECKRLCGKVVSIRSERGLTEYTPFFLSALVKRSQTTFHTASQKAYTSPVQIARRRGAFCRVTARALCAYPNTRSDSTQQRFVLRKDSHHLPFASSHS